MGRIPRLTEEIGGHLSYTLEGLLAEFESPEAEAAFCSSRLHDEIENVRRTFFGLIVAIAGIAALDASFLRGEPVSIVVLSARGFAALASLIGLWLIHARATRLRLEATYVAVWICLATSLSVVAVEQGHGNNQPWQVFYFSASAFVAFLPCRLRIGVFAGSVVVLGAGAVSFNLSEQLHYVTHIIAGTLGAFAGGYSIVLGIERLLRQDYLGREQLRAERTTLEQTTATMRMQLMLAQRAQALGVLAAGTTHDFNNMLMAIRANALSVRDSIAPTATLDLACARDASEDILEAVDSASDLSQRLLTFGKPNSSVGGFVNLDQAAQRVLHMIQRLVPKRIVLRVELNAGNRMVAMQGTYLEQIISNLVVNAMEAVPSSGEITITTGYDVHSERVQLCVSDTGVGMSPEQLGQVFQPFFTTKPTGSGLGLPTVKMLVEESNGEIRVESVPGQGTCVRILLPAATTSYMEAYERPAVSGFIATTNKHQIA